MRERFFFRFPFAFRSLIRNFANDEEDTDKRYLAVRGAGAAVVADFAVARTHQLYHKSQPAIGMGVANGIYIGKEIIHIPDGYLATFRSFIAKRSFVK